VSYTAWFNRRHGRSGHLFQGRFKSVVVEPEGWGLEVSRYLHPSALTEIDPPLLRKVDPLAGMGLEEDFLSK
jgi:hypothetical protein